jgi:hypothetical protein
MCIIPPMKKIDQLRKQCLRLMADKDQVKRGCLSDLAKKINRNRNQVSMALSGYRCTPASEQILKELKEALQRL